MKRVYRNPSPQFARNYLQAMAHPWRKKMFREAEERRDWRLNLISVSTYPIIPRIICEFTPFWETNSCSTCQLPKMLWWSYHINPVYVFPSRFLLKILILSSYLRLGLPNGLFPLCFSTTALYTFIFSAMLTTFLARLMLINYEAPHYAVFSSLLSLSPSALYPYILVYIKSKLM
jgi:hypothetical protein